MLSESPGQTDAHSIATSSDQSISNPVAHPMADQSPENNRPDDSISISSSVEDEGKTREKYLSVLFPFPFLDFNVLFHYKWLNLHY